MAPAAIRRGARPGMRIWLLRPDRPRCMNRHCFWQTRGRHGAQARRRALALAVRGRASGAQERRVVHPHHDLAPGRGPTREQMAEIRAGAARAIAGGMHDATLLSPGAAPPDREC